MSAEIGKGKGQHNYVWAMGCCYSPLYSLLAYWNESLRLIPV